MSNKPSHLKPKNEKITRIGNFHVSFRKDQSQSVKIESASGNWILCYREDSPLFLWISDQIKNEEGRKILHLVFTAYYAVCNGVPDNIFFEDILKAYQSGIDRVTQARRKLSDEEDRQLTEEEREKYNTFKNIEHDARN